jgi:hypothetical protein
MVSALYAIMVCLNMAAMIMLVGVVEVIRQKIAHAKKRA